MLLNRIVPMPGKPKTRSPVADKKVTAESQDQEVTRLQLLIRRGVLRQLKQIALDQNTTVADLIRGKVEELLKGR
jgi:hypothetical protein